MMKASKSVPAYIAAAPAAARPKLRQLRAIIREIVPGAEEKISYGMPGYKLDGKPFMYFGAFKDHVSLFPGSGTFLKAFADELKGYVTAKGTVQFPLGRPLPVALVRKLVKARRASKPGGGY